MEKRFSLAGGAGWLTAGEEGARVRCRARLPNDGKGLYKGWLTGPGGRALLGTFVPQGDGLYLERTLSLEELKRQGAWPPEGAQAVLAFSFGGVRTAPPRGWSREEAPGRLLGEPLLASAAGGPALVRREAGGFSLAYPYRPDRPFPLTPLFCFARLEELEGKPYLRFPFRPGGCPRLEDQL